MRYYYEKPDNYIPIYGDAYSCSHPIYKTCTLYFRDDRGLAVIQQRFDSVEKTFWWGPIDPWLANDIYLSEGFMEYFDEHSQKPDGNGLFPTVQVRKIMWALRMKPLKKEFWETLF